MPVRRTVNQGHDRLTRMADRIAQFAEADPDRAETDRIMILIDNGQDSTGAALVGYVGRDAEDLALADLLRQTRALAKVGEPQLAGLDTAGKLPPGLRRDTGPGWLTRREARGEGRT